ncbi:hypothetical protein BC938DRAFT_476372 [Jimgerdemannia flammicorona]|uniref:Autophagy-related protein 17 n=1 Tax=Jimgerdemannia flammicorona TaxID=994334 RepID=A0A433PHS3_9FUNG|nr:hypothetical protein BC938DRAFT_476372 [Jimgerdemannia flammicorona]
MEQNLIDILIISKKGVQFAETLCSKASTVIQDGRADIEQLERTWAKLRFLANKATVQIRTVDSVAAYVDTIAAGLAEYCESKHADLSDLSAELVHTFHSLRTRKVDEELLRNNLALIADDTARASAESRSDDSSHNPSSSTAAAANQDLKSTLFDYIDDQGVLELERQARTEIADVENLRSNLQSIYHSLIARIESFEHLLAPAFDPVFDQSAAAFARDQCVVQERETTAMADYLLSLTKHYDQVSHALE